MATVRIIDRTIAQPADGNSFIVSVSPPMADTDYSPRGELVDSTIAVRFIFPESSRQIGQFLAQTTAPLPDGAKVQFTLTKA